MAGNKVRLVRKSSKMFVVLPEYLNSEMIFGYMLDL